MNYSSRFYESQAFERQTELREQVYSAKEEYEKSKAEANRLLQIAREAGPDHPDGNRALLLATRIRRRATSRYVEALKTFSDSVLRR